MQSLILMTYFHFTGIILEKFDIGTSLVCKHNNHTDIPSCKWNTAKMVISQIRGLKQKTQHKYPQHQLVQITRFNPLF